MAAVRPWAAAALALSLLCAACGAEPANSPAAQHLPTPGPPASAGGSPPTPGPPAFRLSGMSACDTAECRLHSAVLALASVLALSGAVNVALACYIAYRARMCRSCGKSSSQYAARQASCPLRCARCRRQWDVRFRWSWNECTWVHAAEAGPVLARPSISVFGFPVADAASFHITAVVSAPDAADAPPAPPQAEEPAADVEAGEVMPSLDFYGQDTQHSTRDYFRPGDPVMVNPFFRAA